MTRAARAAAACATPTRLAGIGVAIAAALCLSSVAQAGVVIDANALSAAAARSLRARIDAARKAAPQSFAMVQALRAAVPRYDRTKRGRFVSLLRPLAALGRAARWAMADELAFTGAGRGTMSASAWRGWRMSLLEAIGRLREPEMAPLLRAAVRRDIADRWVARAAVEALARLGTTRDIDLLVGAASRRTTDAATILDALGDCRRTAMVARLTRLLADKRWDAPARRAILKALGRAGNAWAWRTSVVRRSGQERAVRRGAAIALLTAFVSATDGAERERAATSLLIVGWRETPQLIAAARSRHAALADRLDELARRFARSPLR